MKIVTVLATLSAPSRHLSSANFPPIRQQSLGANNIISALSCQAFPTPFSIPFNTSNQIKNIQYRSHFHKECPLQ